ncbi:MULTISPECIES: PEP-utilizing enzyme [Mycobacterium avium complex (MAC)]|jgi:pyruvate,water dikinase|uniref:Peptidase n=1 Tax=Mycobacterium timonense TaxID=701043 RepID=A0ABX3TNQ9_9MYCO|nr:MULTISPECIES: PEP-utilizing enzyme [Mycobacterium avium complex (MAC)]ETZ43994.1 PEP-utilizing enzyme, mobile domain protein [Mycobacterium avium MAV_061107_1842]MBG0727896.1 peptidase [Mycobacterium avium]MBZ4502305.1 peptidase [Mycobacterium avium subsp. hominissuis]MBZ4520635.1 peptidase [Mycobacterium avium subsp. hominissuis]MBZ4531576.1 peptidase [Mycobacterium avium subsp. hominissuis]
MNAGPTVPLTDPIRGRSEPGRLWTLTNVGEATPDILSPLCWSLWGAGVEFASRGGLYDFGVLGSSALQVPDDPNQWSTACFFGRQAMNVDRARELAGLLPGMTGDDFERDLLGAVRPDAVPTRSNPRRLPVVVVKAPLVLARERSAPRRLHERQMNWWRATVLNGRWTDARTLLADSSHRFRAAMRVHVRTRLILNVFRAQVESVAAKAGLSDLVPALLAGYGGVIETELADDVWSLGHGRITLNEFLSRHGFHGPNEGNVIGHSWREDPDAVLRAASAHASRPETDRPILRAERAAAARRRAETDLLSTLPAVRRPLVRRLLAWTGAQVRSVELTKTSFLTAIDGCRAAAGGFGAEQVAAGTLDRVDDACYLTLDELLAPLPANVRDLVEFRRSRREEYRRLEVPSVFTGMPQAIERSAGQPAEDTVIHGTPAGPGIFEGVVRVVVDPESQDTLDDGEVLVCKFVDPGWTALVSLAGALVTDIGSPASHGAIVARELGITCVVGTGNGTRVLRSGDIVRVDGSTGAIAVLTRSRDSVQK